MDGVPLSQSYLSQFSLGVIILNSSSVSGRIAAIDFGTVRIGIAISDPQQSIASPYENYQRRDAVQDSRRFRRLVEDEEVVQFVVGLPLHLDGRESPKSIEARKFGAWLEAETSIPVDYHDERFTSVEAEEQMLSMNMTRSKRKQRRDMLAAQLLLSAYLESDRKGHNPGAID
ncbi:MAG: Holliday junction resolvase RuvX [Planctomycetaceae bacterium]|nr:Holliday junction resolvase RuvX [Planctomycetaceae bacterium]